MNFTVSILRRIVDPEDEFGFRYIEIIQNAINSGRISSKYRYETLKSKKYKEKILLEAGLRFENCEAHHIIPKCCGGTDDPNNIVLLYQNENNKEHLLAHEFLCKSISLFQSFHTRLIIAYNYMSELNSVRENKIKIPAGTSPNNGIKLSKEVIDKRIDSCKKAIKIMYNGKLYRSARELSKEKMFDGKIHDSQTIVRWADMEINGLKIIDSGNKHIPSKTSFDPEYKLNSSTRAIKITYNGKVYRSARELVRSGINEIFKTESTVLVWARNNKNGLSLFDLNREKVDHKQNSIKIMYNGKLYKSARELSKEKMFDGKIHAKSTILDWARKNKNGLQIIN